MRILLFGLASSIHNEEYYVERYNRIIELLKRNHSIEFDYLDKPMINYTELSRDYDLYIPIYLTGGVSNLGFKIINSISKPVLIIASGEHNALASALSTRNKLSKTSIKNYLLPYFDLSDLSKKMEIVKKSIKIVDELRNLHILEINERGIVSESGLYYIERIGGSIEAISFDELLSRANKLLISEINDLVVEIKKRYSIFENNWVLEIAKFIHIVNEIVRDKSIDIVSIDCFPLISKTGYTPCILVSYFTSRGIPVICENDYNSLPLMYIAYRITNLPGWISNPSGYTKEGYLRFAHCTIADSLGFECRTVNHFESNKPYGLTCKFKYRNILFARFNSEYSILRIYRGRVVESGLINKEYCRTQLIIKTPGLEPGEFYKEALGNHHVFMVNENNLIEYLEIISWWMDWRIDLRN